MKIALYLESKQGAEKLPYGVHIENMWYDVTRTMDASANQPTNLAELRQAVMDA